MKQVFKYEIELSARPAPHWPRFGELLDIQFQGDRLMAWVLVDDSPVCPHPMIIVGTGNALPENSGEHIKTVQHKELVWHLFWAKK